MALSPNAPAGGTTGIVLAAGAGTRAGGPKALLRLGDGTPWLAVATNMLFDAGCENVVVVLGAMERLARPLVPPLATIVVATDWESGMSASLRAGLGAARGEAALVTLVDLPDLPVAVARRMGADATAAALRQATFDGRPGHPVLIGADHWTAVALTLHGDRGARRYLVEHGAEKVDCGDLWDGADRDEG